MSKNLNNATYRAFCEIIARDTGVQLGDDKLDFLSSRLSPRANALGLESLEEYLAHVTGPQGSREKQAFLHAVTTHHTFFFREEQHLDTVAEHIARLLEGGQRRIRVWSAACSSGEEPYSLMMRLGERLGEDRLKQSDFKLLGTDISRKVLGQARRGSYATNRLVGVSRERLAQHFQPVTGAQGSLEVLPWMRHYVSFKPLNLADETYPFHGPFDAILCRNVMIYFDEELRQQLLRRLTRMLSPGGLLVIGMSESVQGIQRELDYVEPAVYAQRGASQAARKAPSEALATIEVQDTPPFEQPVLQEAQA